MAIGIKLISDRDGIAVYAVDNRRDELAGDRREHDGLLDGEALALRRAGSARTTAHFAIAVVGVWGGDAATQAAIICYDRGNGGFQYRMERGLSFNDALGSAANDVRLAAQYARTAAARRVVEDAEADAYFAAN